MRTTRHSSKGQGDEEENRSSDSNTEADQSSFVRTFQVAGSSTAAR
jgi:hypothetical protein